MSGLLYAYITVAVAAIPIAIFTIVPNAIVADIAEAHGIETGDFKAGMFFGVRSFETNVGISIANIVFPSLLLLGKSMENPFGHPHERRRRRALLHRGAGDHSLL